MIATFVIFLITIILRITIGSLVGDFPFLANFEQVLTYLVIGMFVLFVIFTVVELINKFRKK